MIYKVKITSRFDEDFKKLDRYTMIMIKVWIEKYLVNCDDPRAYGKALTENEGEWHYRIGDYRLVCLINEGELVILSLTVGQRR